MNSFPIYSLMSSTLHSWNQQFTRSLTTQQMKVATIALAIFTLIGTSILLYKCCFHKGRKAPKQAPDHKINLAEFDDQPAVKPDLAKVLAIYNPHFLPLINGNNLKNYSQSADYQRHAQSARIYYNASQLAPEDAIRVIFQREPTNIAMGDNQYNKQKLQQTFGYSQGIYNDANTKKVDGSSFKALPNTACVYSETYLWDPPGGNNKKEVACLSVPAPALDSFKQPHYDYYLQKGYLDGDKYEQEMQFLFKTIESALRDNYKTAFNNKGIKRLVLSRFGQGAFLGALGPSDKIIANQAYQKQLAVFLKQIQEMEVEVVMSEYSQPSPANEWHPHMIIGDIINSAQEGDFIINAWDPHSAPGNGNDADHSFDGAMGKGSAILLTQTIWLNEHLKKKKALVAVKL